MISGLPCCRTFILINYLVQLTLCRLPSSTWAPTTPHPHSLCVCVHSSTTRRAGRQFVFRPMQNFSTICLGAVLYDNNSTCPKAGIFWKQRNSLTHGCTRSWLKGRDHSLQEQTAAQDLHWRLKIAASVPLKPALRPLNQGHGFVISTLVNWQENSKAITFYFAPRDNIIRFIIEIYSGTISLELNNLKSVCRSVGSTDWDHDGEKYQTFSMSWKLNEFSQWRQVYSECGRLWFIIWY